MKSQLRDLKKTDYANRAACPVCPLRSRCTNGFHKVSRLENEAVLDRMAARLTARPEILDRRREIVEHPFGSIKQPEMRLDLKQLAETFIAQAQAPYFRSGDDAKNVPSPAPRD
jgi:hypothetical protein